MCVNVSKCVCMYVCMCVWRYNCNMAFVLQAVRAVAMKEILTNQVLYILRIPEATSHDSGVYECVVVNEDSGEIRTGRVVVTVFGTHCAPITNTQKPIE